MDIKIEAPGHANQNELRAYCEELLNKKFGKYEFLHAVDVKFSHENDETKVSIMFKPERGVMNYVSQSDKNEHKAFGKAIDKMKTLIEKYKVKHYHNVHKTK